jgi:hypothetical protein
VSALSTSCTVPQDVDNCAVTVNVTTTNATTVTLKDSKGNAYAVGTNATTAVPVNVPVGGETFTLAFGGATNPSVTIAAACVTGTAADSSGVCKVPAVKTSWPPSTITPPGTKVFGANQLPVGCDHWAQQCWRDAVANGTVKFIATPATMTGYDNRPIVVAYFRNTSTMFGVTGMWNSLPIHADDGSLVGADIFGGGSQEEDWVYGNNEAFIVHCKGDARCPQMYWYAAGHTWSPRPADCPPYTNCAWTVVIRASFTTPATPHAARAEASPPSSACRSPCPCRHPAVPCEAAH